MYPKIFLERPKHIKLSTCHIKEWCDYKKYKTMAMQEFYKQVPHKQFIDEDGKIIWDNLTSFKVVYNMNDLSMKPW